MRVKVCEGEGSTLHSPAPMLLPQLVLKDHGGRGCSDVVHLSGPLDGLLVVELGLFKDALTLVGHSNGCLWKPEDTEHTKT